MVEGEDLTVRDNRVYLKTLGGLIAVDVVLRRVRQEQCDPLELGGRSRQGVPGLTHAARRGNVVLANALGSGVIETAAIMPFLPGLSMKLLAEPLNRTSSEYDSTSTGFPSRRSRWTACHHAGSRRSA